MMSFIMEVLLNGFNFWLIDTNVSAEAAWKRSSLAAIMAVIKYKVGLSVGIKYRYM